MEEKKATLGAKLAHGAAAAGAKAAATLTGHGAKSKPQRVQRLKLLLSVVSREDEARLKELLDECSISLGLVFAGTGTARSALLDYLGIGETQKSILACLFPEFDEDILIREIRNKMSLYLVGKGISFTIPLSGTSGIVAGGLCKASAEKTSEGKKFMSDQERKYDLIVAAVAAGNVDEALEAARAAGAAGGTIVRARSVSNQKAEQFIGITLSHEQEILLILAKRESKLAIMNALSDHVGLKTPAGGIVFSLPVDRTVGIAAADEAEMRAEREAQEGKKADE